MAKVKKKAAAKVRVSMFEASDHLKSETAIREFLAAAMEDSNPDVFLTALSEVAKARGIAALAERSGLGRESLYKTLAAGSKPRYETICRILNALEVTMTAVDSEHRTTTMPVAWSKDKLTEFFDAARSNQVATFANKKEQFVRFREIDDCFLKVAENLINPQSIVAPFLLFRSHASFRGAASFAMSGQAAEAYAMMRSGLEHASYASLISGDDALAEIWLRRHDSQDALKKVRKAFTQAALVASIATKDAKLAGLYEKLYQDAIDFGAHPNERSVTGNMKQIKEKGQTRWEQVYLHSDGIELDHALKYTAQAGLCCLHIFAHIFKERFMLLGLIPRIQALRKGL